jgi:predicted acyl esterase
MRFDSRCRFTAVVLFALALPAFAVGSEDSSSEPRVLEVMVLMRDGVRLATTVYLPSGDGPWPVVMSRTPYSRERSGARSSERFIERGFAYAIQDQRGRFGSEGEYTPHESEIEDGYDSVEWAAGQSWSTGKVGMTGASAMGIAANLAACSAPPHLEAAWVVVAPQSLFFEGRFIGGVFKEADTGTWMRSQGMSEEAVTAYRKRVVLDDRWLETDTIFCRHDIEIPIYNVGGWYDLFSSGNIANFQYLQAWGQEGARGNQKLMMGPFGHGQVRGDLEYPGTEGLRGRGEEELRWFDYWLKGIDNGILEEPAVSYYQMAAARIGAFSKKNGYRTSRTWPPDAPPRRYLYLAAGGRLQETPPSEAEASTAYDFDPAAEPVATVGGLNLTLPLGPMDQREIGERSDYLRFTTEPLSADVEIAGKIDLELWVSSDALDTDFMVKVVDVYPDGYEALVLDTAVRARYRHGRRAEDVSWLKPGEPTVMNVDLWHSAITFEKGHRIAVHIASSNYPRFEINPNTGEAPGERAMEPRVARNVIHHDAAHPTALLLPVR